MKNEVRVMCEFAEMVDPSGLKDHPMNPNTHPKSQVVALSKSIKKHGWRHPVIVSKRSDYIVAGHGRKLAALALGCLVPVDYQDFESETEELAVLVSDNVLQELSELDEALLGNAKGKLLAADYDLDVLGFLESEGGAEEFGGDIEIPDIDIQDKIRLEKIVIFAEVSIRSEVLKKVRAAIDGYEESLVRVLS